MCITRRFESGNGRNTTANLMVRSSRSHFWNISIRTWNWGTIFNMVFSDVGKLHRMRAILYPSGKVRLRGKRRQLNWGFLWYSICRSESGGKPRMVPLRNLTVTFLVFNLQWVISITQATKLSTLISISTSVDFWIRWTKAHDVKMHDKAVWRGMASVTSPTFCFVS